MSLAGSRPGAADLLAGAEIVESFADLGVDAFTTARAAGSFGLATDEPVRDVISRWTALRGSLGGLNARLATVSQVHGARVVSLSPGWEGWLRGGEADGLLTPQRGTALAVTVADCVPVFLAHASGAGALLHSGWRGTAARILETAVRQLAALGLPARELRLHCGPAICGRCYEVSAEVYARLTGHDPGRPARIDLRALLADHARALGIDAISLSPLCTRCGGGRFYSHRGGDSGRQLGVLRPRSGAGPLLSLTSPE